MPTRKSGKIITFYSYKGGTGRSMALANVAWILASSGKRVLTIDWDLEAPGLHRYFHPFLADKDLSESSGVIDFVIDFGVEAMTPTASQETLPADWYIPYANILRYAVALDWKFPDGGALDFIPAGRQGPLYASRVNSFNWQNFYDRLGGGKFMDAVRDHIAAEYDYVLIDSRTGVSDTSGICTVQMPDALVVFFTLNNQSIEGAAAVAASVHNQRRLKKERLVPSIFPVPTRIDLAEKDKLELAREYAQARFDPLVETDDVPEADRARYWGEVEVLYFPFYSYEEVLATFADKPGQTNSLLASAERITSYITVREVHHLTPPSDAERERVKALYARQSLSKQSIEAKKAAAAEGVFARLTSEEQEIARRIFMRMVRLATPEETAEIYRLAAPVDKFDRPSQKVLQMFQFAQVVDIEQDHQSREEIATIADARLITGWPRLQGWISLDRTFLLWREELRVALAKWERSKRADSALLQGASLDEASGFLLERNDYLDGSEAQFIQASQLEQERIAREREEEERLRREREQTIKMDYEALVQQREVLIQQLKSGSASASQNVRSYDTTTAQQYVVSPDTTRSMLLHVFSSWRFMSTRLKALIVVIPVSIALVWYFDLTPSVLHLFKSRARLSRQIAASAKSQLNNDPQLSLLLAIEAASAAPGPEAGSALRQALYGLHANTAKTVAELADHNDAVRSAAFSPSGGLIATASADRTAKIWDVDGHLLPYVIKRHAGVNSIRFSPDGRLILAAADDGVVELVSLDSNIRFDSGDTIIHYYSNTFPRFIPMPIRTAEVSPDGAHLLKAYGDTASIVDISNWENFSREGGPPRGWHVVAQLDGHRASVLSARYSPDGKLVVTASLDGTARVWDASSGMPIAKLIDHSGPVFSAEFSFDGKLIVTASADATARVWDASSGSPISVMRGHFGYVRSAKFSPNGEYVVTAGDDYTAGIWETTSGRILFDLNGQHTGRVTGAEFSPDGQYVVTSSSDKTARIWQTTTGIPVAILQGHKGGLNSAQFSPNGKYILTASQDSTARLYTCEACVPLSDLIERARTYATRGLTAAERRTYLR
jgi:WD40 repeat protein/MinD-like ATPase involved in chromosome partitioning or flagellar assembly